MSCVLHVKVPFLKDVSSVLLVKISLDMYDISFLNDVCSVFDIIVNQSRIILNNVCSKMHTFNKYIVFYRPNLLYTIHVGTALPPLAIYF